MLKRLLNRLKALVFAVIVTIILAVILQTQMVISGLNSLGANIGLTETLSMTAYDLVYLSQLYGLFIFIALCVAFLIGGLVYRFTQFGRPIIYIVAGGTAIFILLFTMKKAFFGVHLIAGASDAFGISLQIIAGMIGGFVFAWVSRSNIKQKEGPVSNEA